MITRRALLAGTVSSLALARMALGREEDKKVGRKPAIFAFMSFDYDPSNTQGVYEINPDDATWTKRVEGAGTFRPKVSPDGASLAYSKMENGMMKGTFVEEIGGAARKLTDLGGIVCWSPDGGELIVGNGNFLADDTKTEAGTWRVDVKTGRTSRMAIEPGPQVFDWSRDGKTLLAFSQKMPDVRGDSPLIALDLHGENERVLFDEKNALTIDQHFSADGLRMHYSRYILNKENAIAAMGTWTVALDGSKREQIFEHLDRDAEAFQIRSSPDGKLTAARLWNYTRGKDGAKSFERSDSALFIIEHDGKTTKKLELPEARSFRLMDWV